MVYGLLLCTELPITFMTFVFKMSSVGGGKGDSFFSLAQLDSFVMTKSTNKLLKLIVSL